MTLMCIDDASKQRRREMFQVNLIHISDSFDEAFQTCILSNYFNAIISYWYLNNSNRHYHINGQNVSLQKGEKQFFNLSSQFIDSKGKTSVSACFTQNSRIAFLQASLQYPFCTFVWSDFQEKVVNRNQVIKWKRR